MMQRKPSGSGYCCSLPESLSLLTPFAAGLSVTLIIGGLLLASGIAQLFLVFSAGSIGKGLLLALLAVITLIAGGYMLTQPLSALATLTLFLAGYFVAAGVVESIGAFGARPAEGWGWLLFGGIVSFALGLMLWSQFPPVRRVGGWHPDRASD